MGYYINTSLICATIIGTLCLIIETVALVFDSRFNGHLDDDSLPKKCILVFKLPPGKRGIFRRDSPLEPMFLLLMSFAIVACIGSLVVARRCSQKMTNAATILLTNKIFSGLIAVLFFLSAGILILSIYKYDKNHIKLNQDTPNGCNIGYHHRHKKETQCDETYSFCQKKILKVAAVILTLTCALLGTSAFFKGVAETEKESIQDLDAISQISIIVPPDEPANDTSNSTANYSKNTTEPNSSGFDKPKASGDIQRGLT